MSTRKFLRNLLVTLALATAFTGTAMACLEIPPDPPDFWVVIIDDNNALIIIHDYTTYGSTQGSDFCACALNVPAQFGTVVSATIVDSGTGQPLPGFSFGTNNNTSNGFQAAAPLPPPEFWNGFSSAVSQSIAAGINVDIIFHITNPERLQGPALTQFFRDTTSPLLATDAADQQGNPLGPPPQGHQSIQPANSVQMELSAFGLHNQTVGQATLERSQSGGLIVSNIGSSGQDGVRFVAPPQPVQGAAVRMSPQSCIDPGFGRGTGLRASNFNVDSFFDVFYEITPQNVWQAQVQMPQQPACMQVQVFDDGQQQADVCVPQGQPLLQMPPDACIVEMAWIQLPDPFMRVLLEQPQPISIGGAPGAVSGNEMRLFDPAGGPTFDTEIVALNLRSAPDSFFDVFIELELLQKFDNMHDALGQAEYEQNANGHLVVSNIGSSGLDGVRASPPLLPPPGSFQIDSFFDIWTEVTLPPPPSSPPGSFMQFSATGPVHQGVDQPLGHVTILKGPNNDHTVTADFSPVGSSTTRVEVYLDGQIVFEQGSMTGNLASYADFPEATGKLSSGWPPVLSCFVQTWPTPVAIDVDPGPGPSPKVTVQGDELRILAEGGTPVDGVSSMSVTGSEQPTITIVDEILTPASDSDGDGVPDSVDNCVFATEQCDTDGDGFGNGCDADLDGNNIVNSFDLNLMRASFGQQGANDADLDCNGIVNTFDLGRMRALFGQPPGPSGQAP